MRPTLTDVFSERRYLEGMAPALVRGGLIVGVLGLAATVVLGLGSPEAGRRALHAYLTGFAYLLSLSLGALFFVILHHLTRAGWSVVVRRIAEGIAGLLDSTGKPRLSEWIGSLRYDW